MGRAGLAGCVVIAVVLAFSPALAQPGVTPPSPPAAQTVTVGYAWQIALADLGVGAAALAVQRSDVLVALAFTGSAVHLGHGRPGAALGSALMRAGAPVIGVAIGALKCEPNGDDYDCFPYVLAGFGAGAIAALAVDYLVLARETITVHPAPVQPAVVVTPSSGTVGLRLAF
ncbi:MAG TPA: hypothetical protein VNO33_17720 [Kofleriaceae bacterium]|nr:hypothetical protein [Kofleriaceae bacterium]